MPVIRPPRRCRTRKPSLSAALEQARKAGKAVKGAEVFSDHIKLSFDEGKGKQVDDEVETWVNKHAHQS